jgi:cellobiose phosphorylase
MWRVFVVCALVCGAFGSAASAADKQENAPSGTIAKQRKVAEISLKAVYFGIREDKYKQGMGAFTAHGTNDPGEAIYVLKIKKKFKYAHSTALKYESTESLKYEGTSYSCVMYKDGKKDIFVMFCVDAENDGTYRMFVCQDPDPYKEHVWSGYQFCTRKDL